MNKTLVLDCRTGQKVINELKNLGYSIITIPENHLFDDPISAHPDIFITKIKDKLFVDNSVISLFTFIDEIIICDREADCGKTIKYPFDVCFNCVNLGNNLICNKAYTHKSIIEYAENNGIHIIDVKQGYAKCSTCVVSDNAIITEDDSIASSALDSGIDVLKIDKGYVRLDGYNYGFIGGCSGLIEKDLLVFNGDIEKHPDYCKIKDFCSKYNVRIISLSREQLYDIGSIIRL